MMLIFNFMFKQIDFYLGGKGSVACKTFERFRVLPTKHQK